jgi:4'-phosphopantetheinyl transferase
VSAAGSELLRWSSPQRIIPLREGVVQVWRIDLEAVRSSSTRRTWLLSLLSDDERVRVDAYKSGVGLADLAREQFIAARGTLRMLLGHALGVSPRSLAFKAGAHGKPELAGSKSVIGFNVAHSRGIILVALCLGAPVGVDVEYMDPAVEAVELARTTFTAREAKMIESCLTQAERARAFYRCWTQKEAVVKADGRGLTLPLDSFEVSPEVDSTIEVIGTGNPDSTVQRTRQNYFVQQLAVSENFVGAVAVEVSYGNTRIGFKVDANIFSTPLWNDAL